MSILGSRAQDISFSESELCLVLGYLAKPNRISLIEAEIPEDRIFDFKEEFPNSTYYPITQGYTSSGCTMKQGCQLRIYFNSIRNCPQCLLKVLGKGNNNCVARLNKSKFIEKIVKNYGFKFGEEQDFIKIKNSVSQKHPNYISMFDKGSSL